MPQSRRKATTRDVLSVADMSWKLRYVAWADRHAVERLTLTFPSWKLAIDHDLLDEREALCAPRYTAMARPARRHYCLTPVSRNEAVSVSLIILFGGLCCQSN